MITDRHPVRVLQVFGRTGLGGGESRTMDLYRHLDRDRVQFDFLVHHSAKDTGKACPTSDELMAVRSPDYFDEEIRSLGGRIYCLPRFTVKNILSYKKAAARFFAEHRGEWKAVQGHMTSTASLYMPEAAKAGAVTITHVRSAGQDPGLKGMATVLLRSPLKKKGSVAWRFACSGEAARHVYGTTDSEDIRIIPNAIDVDRFLYDPAVRESIRTSCGIGSRDIVIGHVGRFDYPKNHEYLIRVFASLLSMEKENPAFGGAADESGKDQRRLFLMLLGEGDNMPAIKELAKELGAESRVLFMNNRKNVSDYYQAMDLFCFPSRYEGLPGTVIEAQSGGLPCLISDTITQEVMLTGLVKSADIKEDPAKWAERIRQTLTGRALPGDEGYDSARKDAQYPEAVREAGFDITAQARIMTEFYEKGIF